MRVLETEQGGKLEHIRDAAGVFCDAAFLLGLLDLGQAVEAPSAAGCSGNSLVLYVFFFVVQKVLKIRSGRVDQEEEEKKKAVPKPLFAANDEHMFAD